MRVNAKDPLISSRAAGQRGSRGGSEVSMDCSTAGRRAPRVNPKLALVIGISAVSSASILIRLSIAPPLVIAGFRLAIASAIMGILAISSIGQLRSLDRGEIAAILVSGLALGGHFGTWTASLLYTTIAASTVIVDSSPIFVVLISWILLGERINRREALGIAISIAGSVVIAGGDLLRGGGFLGDMLSLVGAILLAIYLVAGRKLRRKLDLAPYTFVVYGLAAVTLVLSAVMAGNSLVGYRVEDYILFLLLAVGPSCLGHNSYNYALKYLKAAVVSASILGEPVGASILGVIVFGEVPPLTTVLGGAVVLFGVYLTVSSEPS